MGQPRHKRAKKPSNKGLPPEVREAIGKMLPGIIDATAKLIEAFKPHRQRTGHLPGVLSPGRQVAIFFAKRYVLCADHAAFVVD